MDCGIKNIVNNLQEMGYIVRILYAPNGKFDKIKRFSCKEKYNLADYDMKYVLYHEKVVMELYNKVFCQNLKNPKSLTLEILEGTANQLGIFAIEINQFCILTDDATRFSLGYRDFRKIVNYYGYRICELPLPCGTEVPMEVASDSRNNYSSLTKRLAVRTDQGIFTYAAIPLTGILLGFSSWNPYTFGLVRKEKSVV